MATTEHFRNGGGTTFDFQFPILANADLKVEIYNDTTKVWDLKTENTSGQTDNDYTISNTNVVFNSATPSGTGNVHIYRKTNVDNPAAVYAAGSSIRAVDLNDNQTQVLYSTQETSAQLVRETDLKDSIVTSAKIVDFTIVDGDISPTAEIAVSKLANGSANQLLQTADNGTDVEFTSNVDLPGTLQVNGQVDLNTTTNVSGDLTVFDSGTQKFKVTKANGNTDIVGTVSTTGGLVSNNIRVGLTGGNEIDTSSGDLILDSGSGDTLIDDNARVTGTFTADGMATFPSNLAVTGSQLKVQADNSEIAVNNGSGITKFKVDSDTGNTLIQGILSVPNIDGGAIVTTGNNNSSDTKVYSTARADEKFYGKGTAEEIQSGESWSSGDDKVATTAAIDARVIDLVDDVGGFVPIQSENHFPIANPDVNNGFGTLVSIQSLSENITTGSGETSNNTIAQTTAGTAVNISGLTASTTYPSGFGMIVETTDTLNTYRFHRLVPKATEVTTVAGSVSNVNTVAGAISNVNAVAGNETNINSAVSNATNINSAVSNATNINTVAGNNTNISTVAGISGNVTTVAGISSDVTTVANDGTDIGLVAGSISNVNNVGGSIANVNTVGGSIANVNTVASNNTNVNTVAGNDANITTVAGISSNVTTVAGNNSNVTTVAGSIGNVNTTAGSIANVNTTAGSISNVNTVATNITNVNNASTYLNNFLSLYLGEQANDPTVDAVGNAVSEGDLYFNNVSKQVRVYNGNVWTGITEGSLELAKIATSAFSALYTASAGSNNINLGGLAVTGAAFSNEEIAANRVSLAKGSATYNLGGI